MRSDPPSTVGTKHVSPCRCVSFETITTPETLLRDLPMPMPLPIPSVPFDETVMPLLPVIQLARHDLSFVHTFPTYRESHRSLIFESHPMSLSFLASRSTID